MYPVNKNILQTVYLLKAFGIKDIVLSPGSRNAPLIQAFSQDSFFRCQVIVDERSAAFYALGIIQQTTKPTAICCTSGTALLNYAPAVAEAFYQELPLLVISADRTPEWIGQMDGQTIPQGGCLANIVKKWVQLPLGETQNEQWFSNRLINEALIEALKNNKGPVHINIPLAEPLFNYSETKIPQCRKIQFTPAIKQVDIQPFKEQWAQAKKKMIIVGQLPPENKISNLLKELLQKEDCIVLCEHLSNCFDNQFINNFDIILNNIDENKITKFAPDLVISIGGHIVSKKLKHFLRTTKPNNHWQLTQSTNVVDTFQCLTNLIETDPRLFLTQLLEQTKKKTLTKYSDLWLNTSLKIKQPDNNTPFSDLSVMNHFIKHLPHTSDLHLANSWTVRNAQFFALPPKTRIYCNRGTNGIDSSLASAIGFASVSNKPTYLAIGDLSFFYGLNSLWNINHINNIRILLFNNSGGNIFHLLNGLDKAQSLEQFVATKHSANAKKWAEAANIRYLSANNQNQLEESLKTFFKENTNQSLILEVHTSTPINTTCIKDYFKQQTKKLK